jgi:type 2A phosphatase activator TIP41
MHQQHVPPALARPPPTSAAAVPYRLDEDGGGIEIGGWRVRATRAPIIGDAAVEDAQRALGGVLTVPEILFGNSRLELRHAGSGVTLHFDALDALRAWRQEDLPPLKVSVAQQWQAARREEIERQAALVLEYDWTYTTPYQGTLEVAQGAPGGEGGGDQAEPSQGGREQPPEGAGHEAAAGQQASGTVSRQICTSLRTEPQSPLAAAQAHAAAEMAARLPPQGGSASASPVARAAAVAGAMPAAPLAASPACSAAPATPAWAPTQRTADRSLLLSRDEPILFFADVPLYESELDDNGVSALGVKVRVMPRCWLVLLRFWLRVDGALMRLRETRLFCRWDCGAGGDWGETLPAVPTGCSAAGRATPRHHLCCGTCHSCCANNAGLTSPGLRGLSCARPSTLRALSQSCALRAPPLRQPPTPMATQPQPCFLPPRRPASPATNCTSCSCTGRGTKP